MSLCHQLQIVPAETILIIVERVSTGFSLIEQLECLFCLQVFITRLLDNIPSLVMDLTLAQSFSLKLY